MHALKVYRDKSKGVSDLLNWAALVDDGRILCKDGEIIGGFFYSCKDTASSTEAERNYISGRVNTALSRFDNHWTITHDAVRMPSSEYPAEHLSHFPDPITRLIEAENRTKFLAEGNHFETNYVLILAYRPPLRRQSKVAGLMYDVDSESEEALADKHLAYFNKTLEDLADSLNGVLKLQKMGSYTEYDELWDASIHNRTSLQFCQPSQRSLWAEAREDYYPNNPSNEPASIRVYGRTAASYDHLRSARKQCVWTWL
jgi:type IV secretion system protein TrbE